ncbi:peptidylprolyl isomerase [cf. Phormidesmis sp. LEGE 11477]|uniref:FKBP-type peptidyl-prolyl cis-trans isomerase n=1 Tax=cf. Phormidesmis sp. LEGE 11477 TaxID=1828680 RepID=UPI00187E9D5B|nr:peptidylprolyl isomerase [cf. Phormidesmis sp. LEGE 11477]MBE9061434.1 peptidylprolyl isomerase [cf. Phormidesmis sp. LEGE 11477]
MTQSKSGDTVRVHYTGTLNNGQVFDSSKDRAPLEFTLGTGMVIAGFDTAVTGLSPGESITTTIPVDKAYGPYQEEMVAEIERANIPADFELEVGQRLEMQVPGGEAMAVTITDIQGDTVTLDGNHPLAGQDLTFELELVEIM